MTKTIAPLVMFAALLVAATPAAAQTPAGPKTYINASFGVQPGHSTDAVDSVPIFDENALFTAEHKVGTGPFFEIAGGHRVYRNIIVGVAFTASSASGSAVGTASIPDSIFVNRPATIAVSLDDLSRSEQAFHFQAVWFRPLNDKIDIALSAGPSVIHVKQEFLSGVVPAAGSAVTLVADEQSGTGVGFNVGADATYLLTPRYGVGVLIRYSWASVDLPAADVTAGGLQIGAGIRIRF